MQSKLDRCLKRIAQPRRYSGEQWFALTLSILCLSCDAWAIIHTVQQGNGPSSLLSGIGLPLGVGLWILEGLLGLAAVSLLGFAFSNPPSA